MVDDTSQIATRRLDPVAPDETSQIATKRLDLLLLTPAFLAGWLLGERGPHPGFDDPAGFLVGAEDVVRLRLAQLDKLPAVGPWLLRAVVVREQRIAVGFIGFHDAPDDRGVAEIGYEILPAFRRSGYASEAAAGLIEWAGRRGVRVVRASISPDNAASLALVRTQGFVHVGEQIDEEDGRELVFEKSLA